jgi:hypothetical protein
MEMKDIREIHVKIRNKYSPEELKPEILISIVDILFEYLNENNQADRLNPEDQLSGISGNLICDSQNCDNK